MRKLEIIFLTLACFGIFSSTMAKTQDLGNLAEFRDVHKRTMDAMFIGKPWSQQEKAKIQSILSMIQNKAPGLLQRISAYRPMKLYRTDRIGAEDAEAFTDSLNQAMFLPDKFFNFTDEDMLRILTHELVHVADPFGKFASGKDWKNFVEPAMERVKTGLQKMKPGLNVHAANMESKNNKELFNSYLEVAKKEGFPSFWACLSPTETLAEDVTYMLNYNFSLPAEVKVFIQKNLLSSPFSPDPATKLIHQGMSAMEEGKPDEAIQDFNQSINLDHNFSMTYLLRAKAWDRKGDLDKAIADYTQAIGLTGSSPDAYFERGMLYSQKKESDKAIADFSEYIKLVPFSDRGWDQRAREWVKRNEYDKAIADYTELIKSNPAYFPAYYGRGGIYAARKEYGKAVLDFDEMIKITPNYELGYFSRALSWMYLGEFSRSVADFSEAIKRKPDYMEAYVYRGTIYLSSKEFDKAMADFDEIVKISPNSEVGYYMRGQTWEGKRETDKAIAEFSETLKRNPNYKDALIHRGNLYFFTRQFDKSLEDFSAVIKLEPNSAEGYYYRALALLQRGDTEKALADFEKIIKVDPTFIPAYANRADILYSKKEYDAALADANKAIELKIQNAAIYILRGKIFNAKKEFQKALADYEQVIKLDPNLTEAYAKKAWVLAGCIDKSVRNGPLAVEAGKKACELSQWKDPYNISILAAGYAESGNFEEAVKLQTQALGLAPENRKSDFQYELDLYKSGKSYVPKN